MLAQKYRIPKEYMEKVVKFGKGPNFKFFYVKSMANSFKNSRFVVVVGKKVAKTSVQRHLLKRRLWAILDKMDKSKFKEQTDFAFFVKTTFISTDIPEIKQQVEVCVLK